MKGQKKHYKRITAMMLVMVMTLTMVLTFAGCSAQDGVTPQLRINAATNEWEVSYDQGDTWTSMGVKATGEAGADGKDGADGINGVNGKDGKDGVNGTNGKDGVDGEDGKDGIDGKDGKDVTMEDIIRIIEDYETFKTVASLMKNVNFGKASCFGTSACFGSVYYRVLADDHDYYAGAAGIANYLKGVFVEDEDGKVSVNMNSGLGRISYTDALTTINFASAFSSYNEYIVRNDLEMPADIAAQKELAIKYFNTVDYTAEGYNKHTGAGLTYPSNAVAVVALGSLMEQTDTERYDTLIKAAYDNVDAAFWNSGMYLTPFYQLCSDYDWFTAEPKVDTSAALTDANILSYYAYGIDLAKDYPELWKSWVKDALSDNALDAAEAKAFAYHYAYQISGGDVDLGVYGSSRAMVDFSSVLK